MPIRFECVCGRSLRAAEEQIGRKVRCPVCNAVRIVPGAEPACDQDAVKVRPARSPESQDGAARSLRSVERPAGSQDMVDEEEENRPCRPVAVRRIRRRTKTRSSNQILALILGGAVCALVLVVAVIVAIQSLKGPAKEPGPIANVAEVVQRPTTAARPPDVGFRSQKEMNRASKPAIQAPELPVWKPDSLMLAELAPESAFDNYSIRPPKGYFKLEAPQPEQGQFFGWGTEPRQEDGTRASITMLILPWPAEEPLPPLEHIHEQTMESLKARRQTWQATPTEPGLIGGMRFERSRWSGIDANLGPMHGFGYTALDGQTVIAIRSQDVEPHHERALKLAEAAVLTFRRR